MVKVHPAATNIRLQHTALAPTPAPIVPALERMDVASPPETISHQEFRGIVIAGRFRIVGDAAIGNGSGGEVWEGIDLTTGTRYFES